MSVLAKGETFRVRKLNRTGKYAYGLALTPARRPLPRRRTANAAGSSAAIGCQHRPSPPITPPKRATPATNGP